MKIPCPECGADASVDFAGRDHTMTPDKRHVIVTRYVRAVCPNGHRSRCDLSTDTFRSYPIELGAATSWDDPGGSIIDDLKKSRESV